jgi:hypothetical protein
MVKKKEDYKKASIAVRDWSGPVHQSAEVLLRRVQEGLKRGTVEADPS